MKRKNVSANTATFILAKNSSRNRDPKIQNRVYFCVLFSKDFLDLSSSTTHLIFRVSPLPSNFPLEIPLWSKFCCVNFTREHIVFGKIVLRHKNQFYQRLKEKERQFCLVERERERSFHTRMIHTCMSEKQRMRGRNLTMQLVLRGT